VSGIAFWHIASAFVVFGSSADTIPHSTSSAVHDASATTVTLVHVVGASANDELPEASSTSFGRVLVLSPRSTPNLPRKSERRSPRILAGMGLRNARRSPPIP